MRDLNNDLFDRIIDRLHGRLWRAVVFVVLVACAVVYPLQYTLAHRVGGLGIAGKNVSRTAVLVAEVYPGSPADRAGIRPGDRVDYTRDDINRVPVTGETLAVSVSRGTSTRRLRLVTESAPPNFGTAALLRAIVNICLWCFGMLVLARGWTARYGPAIATLIAANILSAATDDSIYPYFAAFGFTVSYIDAIVATVAFGTANVLTFVLCCELTRPHPRALSILAFLQAAACAVSIVLVVVAFVPVEISGWPRYIYNLYEATYLTFPIYAVPLGLLIAFFSGAPEGKARFRWLFLGLFPYSVATIFTNGFAVPEISDSSGGAYVSPALDTFGRLVELLAPVGFFYGFLVRRAFDLGFVISRVAVYSVVSLVLVGAFVAIEYLAAHFFIETRQSSVVFQLGLALGVGISSRYVHRWVDSFVDNVFFAKRHANEKSLREFSLQAPAFASHERMLDRAIQVLDLHTEAEGAAIYNAAAGRAQLARSTGGTFPDVVDVDDMTLVRLRTTQEPCEINESALPHGMAFPAIHSGELQAFVAVLQKRDHTAYAPDEYEALRQFARALGDALSSKRIDDLSASIAEQVAQRLAGVSASLPMSE